MIATHLGHPLNNRSIYIRIYHNKAPWFLLKYWGHEILTLNCSEDNEGANLTLMKIRHAALGKAFDDIRRKRFELDEKKDRGHISETLYQKLLLNLVVESNGIRSEREDLEGTICLFESSEFAA